MKEAEVLALKSKQRQKVKFKVKLTKLDDELRLATGEVYAPMLIDSHTDMMQPDDVRQMAHEFLMDMRQTHVDVMHNNKPAGAVVVESWIAKNHPDFNDDAWVATIKVFDDDLWADIKSGKFNGFSIEMLAFRKEAEVEIEIPFHAFGKVEKNDGHTHAFFVQLDDKGRVIGGKTSVEGDHFHEISHGTATDQADGHSHRFFLP
jgi:hypothetical protein